MSRETPQENKKDITEGDCLDDDLNERASILREAEALVNGDRNDQYGDPNQDFARTAVMWSAYIDGVAERKLAEGGADMPNFLDTWDVAWMMVLLKSSRATTSPLKRDHYADAAGYVACGWDCASTPESEA